MTTDKLRMKRVERAQIRVLVHLPFFAPAVAKLPVIFDNSVPTACTDGETIRWNTDWFDSLDDSILPTVLCHEACHCLLGHIWRLPPPGGDHDLANQAADHAVNLMLKEFSQQVTAGKSLADPFPFPTDKPLLADPQFAGMSEETIYHRLASQPKQPGNGSGKPKAGASGCNQPGQSGGKPSKSPISNPSAFGGPSTFGQFQPSKKGATAQKQDKSDWDATLMQCVICSKGRGELPGSVSRFVGELLSPKVPWVELLRSFLREQVNDDWNFMKPNVLFDDGGLLVPSLDSEGMGSVVFAVDTSGSIDHEMLKTFKSEMQGCLDDMKPTKLLELCCDTKITAEREYNPGESVLPDAPGGGGTSFKPVFDRLGKLHTAPKCVVYLTDLDGTFPDEAPGYPVLWVVYGNGEKSAPFGEVIKAD